MKGEMKRKDLLERIENKKLQTKISDALKILPRNKIILLEQQEEKERQILLEETKMVLWKRWRQKKGRRSKEIGNERTENASLALKLEKIRT